MRLKLFLFILLAVALPTLAQKAGVVGKVVDATTGSPIAGATVILDDRGIEATTDPAGSFSLTAEPGTDMLIVLAYGYNDATMTIEIPASGLYEAGTIKLQDSSMASNFQEDMQEIYYDESLLDEEEGNAQSIGALTGANDDIYYKATSYDFSAMRFRYRGYDSEYQNTYINGIDFNDLARGRFNYSTLGGMSRAFRDKTTAIGISAANFAIGGIGGVTDINTLASSYAKGFNGSVAYTNSNYMLRAMATYSTGLTANGWAFTVSAVGRYANEGVIEGTFYNSGGLFMSLQKIFNEKHSLNLTVFGAPTQRATASPTYLEAYELAGTNLYNPNWGYQDGKKRSARIAESFDPTAVINWVFKNGLKTTVNTGLALRSVNYSSSALNWYNTPDPRPDYYRYLPSYYKDDQEAFDLYTDLWHTVGFRQLNWDRMYTTNRLNSTNGPETGANDHGSSYILENRHSNQFNAIFSSTINHRLNNNMTLQGGVTANYTRAHYFKTIRDLLGGDYWLDVDQYSERDYPDNPQMMQNNLLDPNRRVEKGDIFGYNYYINALQVSAWLQNIITLPRWDINYGVKMGYTQFYRDGKMQNGRAPENSYGKGETHRFDTGALKAGATYKINGRNFIQIHGEYETRAPLFEYAYISPRIKDTAIDDLQPERILTGDISYVWNYRRFRGSVSGFWTEFYDQTERTSFYDDQYQTFMNYVLKGVHKTFKGIEIGMAYKITPSLTLSAAGTFARYQYKNRPIGVRSYENGMMPDTAQVVYLKNFFVGGTPQVAGTIGLDWVAPGMWFLGISGTFMGQSYVNLSPIRHEALPKLWEKYPDVAELEAKMDELAHQDKLNDAFTLNVSIGKLIYINRTVSLNLNLNIDNVLNNRNIMTYGYQQGRFDYTNYDIGKYPNKYSYSQGIKIFFNVGVRF
ncbi:MAG: TonB-dependent receptor [Muribaculaceae bacterium]|nr:TonB-dependent receptor [Muribaculaceae bacterium]